MSNLHEEIHFRYCQELRERIKFLSKEEGGIDFKSVDKLTFELLEKYRKVLRDDSNNNINFVKDTLGRQGGVVAVRDNNSNEIIYLIDYIYEYHDEYDDEKYDISVYGAPDPYKTAEDGEWYDWSKHNFIIDWKETVMAMKEQMLLDKIEWECIETYSKGES